MTQFKLGKVDLSQIECRILNTLAGQWDVIEKFRSGVDIYSELASKFYGFPVDKSRPAERGTGKQLELSCLGPGTLVLTDDGPTPITSVKQKHRLWDGIEWVTHQGLSHHGVRTVMPLVGIWLTPDHLVWSGKQFLPADRCNESILLKALASASVNLPSQAIGWVPVADSSVTSSDVLVDDLSTNLLATISIKDVRADVINVPNVRVELRRKNIEGTQTSVLTIIIADDCFPELRPLLRVASRTIATAVAGYPYTLGGYAAQKGEGPFLPIFANLTAGTDRIWKSIVSTMIAVMSRGISALPHVGQTPTTEQILGLKMPVYDLNCTGPRNRFTILSKQGPLIVHNCGYGAGGPTIVRTARAGTYGPPVRLTDSQGMQARDLYRGTHPFVTALWERASQILWTLQAGHTMEWGPPGQTEPCILIKDHRIFGPGGTWLDFTSLKRERLESGEEVWLHRVRQGWRKTYGARLVENVVQWLARMVISQALVQIVEMGYRVPLTVHDDLFILIPHSPDAQEHLNSCAAVVGQMLAWMPACPIAVEADLLEALDK